MPRARWTDFTGGLWIPSDPDGASQQAGFAVPPNALLEAQNVEFLDGGGVRGRRGWTPWAEVSPEVAYPIHAMGMHYPRVGPVVSGTSVCVGQEEGVSGETWSDPENTEELDGSYAECAMGDIGNSSRGLLCLDPYNGTKEVQESTLSGVIVEIVRRARPAGGIYDKTVSLWRDGGLAGTNRALTTVEWPSEWASILYGGPGDTWGLSDLTVADLNASDFGVYLDVESQLAIQFAQVQYVAIYAYVNLERVATMIVGRYFKTGSKAYRPHYTLTTGGEITSGIGASALDDVLPTPYRPRFVPWQELDATFVFDGANPVKRFDGRSFVTGPSAAQRGPYAALWRNRMWATAPAELAYSVYASAINDVESWPPQFQLSVGDPRAGTITGLEADGDRLAILKDSGVWVFEGDIEFGGSLQQISEIGCVAHRSVVVLPEGIAYVSEDGVFLLPRGGDEAIELSRPIRALFRGRSAGSKYTEAVAAYVRTRRQLWVKLSPSHSGAYVAHYISSDEGPRIAWSYVPGVDMSAATTLDGEGDDSDLIIGGDDGQLRQYDTGTTDNGDAIVSRVRTASRQLDPGYSEAQVRRLVATARARGAMEMAVRYDKQVADAESQPYAAGDSDAIVHPRVTFVDLAQKGRFASVSVECSSGPDFELHVLDADFVAKTPLRWNP